MTALFNTTKTEYVYATVYNRHNRFLSTKKTLSEVFNLEIYLYIFT